MESKVKYSLIAVAFLFYGSAFAATCTPPASGFKSVNVGALKERELIPTLAYGCDASGNKTEAGAFTCVQSVFCVYMHSGVNCEPDSVQGGVFRMAPNGEVLERYSLNVDKNSYSAGKPLYDPNNIAKDLFCKKTNADRTIRRVSKLRFNCLCENKNCNSKYNSDLSLYAATIGKSDSMVDQEEKLRAQGVAEYVYGGPNMAFYRQFDPEQSARLLDIVNGVIPIRSCETVYSQPQGNAVLTWLGLGPAPVAQKVCSGINTEKFKLDVGEFTTIASKGVNKNSLEGGSSVTVAAAFVMASRTSLGGCTAFSAKGRSGAIGTPAGGGDYNVDPPGVKRNN